jgi:glutamyl-tRNA synthetase
MPQFAHLPLLLKPTGNGKLSKRDGDKMGFPVFPLYWRSETGETASGYREDGYFPEAFVNLIALLGWNPGNDQEILSMGELIQLFNLEKVGKSGSKFDPKKAEWFNHQYLVKRDNHELAQLYLPILKEKGVDAPVEKVERIVGMIKDRSNFVKEFWGQSAYFFQAPESYDAEAVKKRWKDNAPALVAELKDVLKTIEPFTAHALHDAIAQFLNERGLGFGLLMNALRICIVGSSTGADLTEIMEIIGKDETLKRIDKALNTL